MTTNVIHTGFLTAIIFIDDILKLDYNTIGKSFTSSVRLLNMEGVRIKI